MLNFGKQNLNNLDELNNFTKSLARFLRTKTMPYYVLLKGNLGTGKTTLTQYLLRNLGVKEVVTSPTFVILKQYKVEDKTINHMDAYRLTPGEDLGIYEELFENSLNIIEWPEHLDFNWKTTPHLEIKIKWINKSTRQIEME